MRLHKYIITYEIVFIKIGSLDKIKIIDHDSRILKIFFNILKDNDSFKKIMTANDSS